MTMHDNTSKSLDSLAIDIKKAIVKREENEQSWVESTLELIRLLKEARDFFDRNDTAFGKWRKSQQFRLDPHEQASAIKMGYNLEAARQVLAITGYRKLRKIEEKEFTPTYGPQSIGKKSSSRKPRVPSETEKQAAEMFNAGATEPEVEQATGISAGTANTIHRETKARQDERAKVEAEIAEKAFDKETDEAIQAMPEKQRLSVTEAVARMQRRLQKEFDKAVQDKFNECVKGWRAKFQNDLNRAYRVETSARGIFTEAEVKILLKCLHPDNSAGAETRTEGFRIFNEKKGLLTKVTPRDYPAEFKKTARGQHAH
jgi:hypothetical protein